MQIAAQVSSYDDVPEPTEAQLAEVDAAIAVTPRVTDAPRVGWLTNPFVQLALDEVGTTDMQLFARTLLGMVDAFEATTGMTPVQAAHFAHLADRWLESLDTNRQWQVAWKVSATSRRVNNVAFLHEMLDLQPPQVVANYLGVTLEKVSDWLFPLVPPADLSAAVESYMAGMPVPEAAALHNISPRTMYRYLHWFRVPQPLLRLKDGRTMRPQVQLARVRELSGSDLTVKAIQDQIGTEFPDSPMQYHAVYQMVTRARKAAA